ncbi:MAG: alpha/beta hydrolase [Spirochaetes bacterium]|nr:alpha/beta hydrolase [Spirochaetota bacterium]
MRVGVALAMIGAVLFAASCSYLPEFTAASLDPLVSITETREAIVLTKGAPGPTTVGFMFSPGGLVDPHGYLPLLTDIAAAGIPVVVAKAPGNLAVFSPNAGLSLRALVPGVDGWVIGGHSLGGAMAAWSAHDNPEVYRGVVFLAAYPPDTKSLAEWPHPVLSISAENDGLATQAKIDATLTLLPPQQQWLPTIGTSYTATTGGYAVLHRILGGTHAQFGSYGPQNGDGTPTISADAQRAETRDFIVEFFTTNGWL